MIMSGIHNLTLFIVSGLLLNMAPGPDSLLIMTRSATQGWRAGSAAALGIGSGTLVHTCAAALGLSALLATSATAFTAVKWLGAIYLLYVGVGLLRSQKKEPEETGARQAQPLSGQSLPYRKIFLQGLLTNILNPKVAVFFLAFVPQFIAPDAPNKALAFALLGGIFVVSGLLWCNFLSVSTALASNRIKINATLSSWLNRLIGGLFISFGIRLALAKQN
jgi:RhtB (resistance to homoserine/threonine) family protein